MKFISLGPICQIANQLNRMGLKKETLPFDYVSSDDFEKVVDLILNGFDGYTDRNNFEIRPYQFSEAVCNVKYGVFFPHDIKIENNWVDFEDFQTKYTRRINRFNNLDGPLTFIRKDYNGDCTTKQIARLATHIDFKFIKLIHGDSFKFVERIDNVVSYVLPDKFPDGNFIFDSSEYDKMWKEILNV